jgi:hypothetical protein
MGKHKAATNELIADPLRAALKAAHQRRDAAKEVRDRIASSVERADAMTATLQTELRTSRG